VTLDLYDQVRRDFDRFFGVRRDNEQHAPFESPTQEEINTAREGIDAVKARNKAATPTDPLLATHEGAEL
jgi:hypothetical protein